MSRRHERAFTDTFDIYRPLPFDVDSNKMITGQKYPSIATYEGVVGRLEPQREVSQPGVAGRSQQDTRITVDTIRLHIDQPCEDTWYVQLTTVGHPEVNTWFQIMGMAENMNWRAKTRLFYAKRTNKPPRAT